MPVGPFTLTPRSAATEPLAAIEADATLDALPLLDHRLRHRTLLPEAALRGSYLALGDGAETRLLRLDRDITHIGRGSAADVRLDDHRVSRGHAILVRHGRHFRLLDNRSANGTFVNGRRIIATNVAHGDVIRIGPVVVTYIQVA